MVSQELLEILRCPNCVRNGPEAGLLDHVGNWLICRDCDRKYPIRDDIPVMLIEEGDRFTGVPREQLPEVPPPEERATEARAESAASPLPEDGRRRLLLSLIGLALGVGLVALIVFWLSKQGAEE